MRHKLYLAAMVFMPLFVGSGATLETIRYFSGYDIGMNHIAVILLAVAGIVTGIVNLWSLIKKVEN
ncbi:MAG: hypothetical protein ACOX4I_03540 [Anaerovoracaceae bacterium]|jgi:hypothetical protein